ncbi:PAS domain S-box protein [Novosphingobium aquiterrae]|uniref:histidine kinase n=1 Tax=Novosphingobium aquiterrae TaxID=624388 RepID=A0ABV6PDQ5_9SPHN
MSTSIDPAQLFEAIVNSSDAAIVSKDLESRVLSWNPAAEAIFGWTAEEMIGQSIRRIIPADRQQEEDLILDRIKQGESATRMETVRLRKDGSEVHVAVLVSPVRDNQGRIIGASKLARDLTGEIRTKQALSELEQRFSMMADNIAQLAWITDPHGWVYWYNRRWFDFTGATIEDVQGWGWKELVHPDHLERVTEEVRHALDATTDWEDTFPLRRFDGTYRWFLCRAVPARDADGKTVCWFGTATDVTEQRDAERRIELLLMEVNHRSKNLLTVIQSLARRSAADSDDFIPRLEQRIAGLAANQDVLVHRNWSDVPLRELIAAQLRFLERGNDQVVIEGDDVVVVPSAAEAVSMALHELATNAEKYGALSVPEGRVTISWAITGSGDAAEFALHWRESGGPLVSEPENKGFGSRIIEEVPRGKLRATIEVAYPRDGYTFVLRCPPRNVLAVPD